MIRLIFALLILINTAGICAKGKLFIIGGGKRPQVLLDRLFQESGIKKGGYAIILPMASEEPDSALFYAKKQFLDNNLDKVFGINVKLNEPIAKARFDSIVNADLIYITGGDQRLFMSVVKSTNLKEAICKAYEKGATIAGTSAGAAVMSERMITGNQLLHKDYQETFSTIEANNVEFEIGLGLIRNVLIDQHFIKRSRHNRLITSIIENPQWLGIGIDEATAILVKGNEVEIVGDAQVLVYSNPKKSKRIKNGKLGASDLNLSIYLAGETFTIPEN